ncbi:MAG: hypothetical protein ACKO7B_12130, partial [Flavobacteriales bacterium]
MKKHYLAAAIVALFVQQLFAQDNCTTAMPIVPGYYIVDAVNGTEPPSLICSGPLTAANNAEWYSYTPDADYYMTVSSYVEGVSPTDTRMHIYTGTC